MCVLYVCVCERERLSAGRDPCLRSSGEMQSDSISATIQQKTGGRETERLPGIFSTDTLSTALNYLYWEGCVRGCVCVGRGEVEER